METNDKNQKTDNSSQEREDPLKNDQHEGMPSEVVESHRKEIERIKQEADANYNLYLRSLADAENGRKRLLKEVESSKRYALEGFLKDVLPVLDGFEKALLTKDQESAGSSLLEGIAIVRRQLLELLEKNGLQAISSEGKKFDPTLHQAIKRTESADVTEEIVECEYAKAYKIYDRLLRPAIVSVLVPFKEDSND